ncbi:MULTISPECIES: SDR family oxidoreductase [Acinetobacter]|uniref:SDR family oxidoreductase n=1 Tax=Acinetobacter TaxID=469 RepID=UPI000EA2CF39|nr:MULTISPECIES: SDR family oxidoreductase [Acinetobacter]RKG46801.1 SDR family oxidoreductase [Acinetobacter cumulans]RZG62194.1 SDR family oxidoreductase [Acinetobacter sp. WCHAc060006]
MILVTGATGNLGQSVVKQLQQHLPLNEFSVLARSQNKAQQYLNQGIKVIYGDFDQPQTLEEAFRGINKLLLISTMEQNRFEQHKNVIDAAKKAGVKHIFYTSLAIQNIETSAVKDLMISHFQTEDYLKASGLKYTILRNSMYAEAIPQIIGEQAIATGLALAGGTGKVPYALRAEFGEAAANALMQDGHENKIYSLVGSRKYSYQDIADLLSEISKQKVNYQNLDDASYRDMLHSIGLPDFIVYLTHGTVADIQQHQYEVHSTDLEKLLGRKTPALTDYLTTVYTTNS